MLGLLNNYLQNLSISTISNEETSSEEQHDFDDRSRLQTLKHTDDKHKAALKDEQQNRNLRLEFAQKLYKLTIWVLVIIAILVLCTGILHFFGKGFLSDKILIALIVFAGTDMLGIFAIILTYLFNKRKRDVQ